MKKHLFFLLCALPYWLMGQTAFTDNFSTGLAQWQNATDYTVQGGELRLTAPAVTGSTYIVAAAAMRDSVSWEFYWRAETLPSTTNQIQVFLQSDNANLGGSLNGYYLQIGQSNADAMLLYKRSGATNTLLATSLRSFAASPTRNIAARMRVTRNAVGEWNVYADTLGGSNFVLEASATDNTYPTGAYFGFNTKYSSTNNTKFVYDDVRIAPLFSDITPPSLLSATPINATAVDVLFNEPLQAASAATVANYSLNNGASLVAATLDAANFALVHLTTLPLTNGTTYTLTSNNIQDAAGNTSGIQTQTFAFVNIEAAVLYDVLINEIMADVSPTPAALPAVEWLELYNRSNKYINANTLQIKTGSSTLQTLPSAILSPNSYTIITKTGNETLLAPFGTVLAVSSFALTDAGATIILQDMAANEINKVAYADTWYNDAVKKSGGWSLELKNPQITCLAAPNWTASTDVSGGTPGRQNSVYNNTPDTQAPSIVSALALNATTLQIVFSEPVIDIVSLSANNFSVNNGVGTAQTAVPNGDNILVLSFASPMPANVNLVLIANVLQDCGGNTLNNVSISFTYFPITTAALQDVLINEIMADTNPTPAGLPAVEWVELYNRSNKYISTANLQMKFGSGSLQTLPDSLLAPNTYIIVCKDSDAPAMAAFGRTISVASLSLTDGGATILLQDLQANEINKIVYADTWYNSSTKKNGGWSLERKNPLQPCATISNWTASNDVSGGTPGRQNSVYNNTPDTQAPSIASAMAINATTVQVKFSEILYDAFSLSANNYSVSNGVGSPTAAALAGDDLLNLTFGTNLPANTPLTITASTIRDCSNNNATNRTAVFTYRPTSAASRYDVLLNEVFPDPSNSLGIPAQEYIELYNRSTKNIQLEGMLLISGTSSTTLPFYVLEPEGYIIITGTDGADFSAFGQSLAISTMISLSNPSSATSGDDVRLADASGNTIDAIVYDKTWWKGAATTKALERVNAQKPCTWSDNWRASTSLFGGTPGAQNSVNDNTSDFSAPIISRAIVESPQTVTIYFDKAITSVLLPNMFSIDKGIGAPLSVSSVSPYFRAVTLLLGQDLQASTIYTISLTTNVKDCLGNSIADNSATKVVLPDVVGFKDIIINEILCHPKTGGIQFIELYNRSKKVIDLKDFLIAARSTDTTERISINYLLFPDDYVVLTENDFLLKQQNNVPHPDKIVQMPLPSLKFAGDDFFLLRGGVLIDSLSYSETWHTPLLGAANITGVSLERINPDGATNNPSNWHSAAQSVGFATPTYRNSQYFNSTITDDSEVLVAPATFSPDGDGFDDFTNVVFKDGLPGYVASVAIYDIQGRPVQTLAKTQLLGTADTIQWDGTYNTGQKVPIGIYVFAISMFNASGDVKQFKKTVVVAGRL